MGETENGKTIATDVEEPQNGKHVATDAVEPQSGNVSSAVAESEEEPLVGPGPAPRSRPKRPLQFEHAYLDALPSAQMYALILVLYEFMDCFFGPNCSFSLEFQ